MNLQSQIIINAGLNPSLFIQHPSKHASHQRRTCHASTKSTPRFNEVPDKCPIGLKPRYTCEQ